MLTNNHTFGPGDVPFVVAGFVAGMFGDNKLDEIKTCLTGGETLAKEIGTAFDDIKEHTMKGYIQAGLQFAVVLSQLGHTLDNCESMSDDVTAIEQWATIFEDPIALASKVALHYARHRDEINTDITSLETDWDNTRFFNAGYDIANIATLAIGPIQSGLETVGECVVTTDQVREFTSGFLYGFTGNDYEAYFQTCLNDTPAFEAVMCEAYNDVISGSNPVAMQGVGLFASQVSTLNGFLQGCPDAAGSTATVGSWYKYWAGVPTKKLYYTIYQNLMTQGAAMGQAYNAMIDDFAAGNLYASGADFATLATTACPIQGSADFPAEFFQ